MDQVIGDYYKKIGKSDYNTVESPIIVRLLLHVSSIVIVSL